MFKRFIYKKRWYSEKKTWHAVTFWACVLCHCDYMKIQRKKTKLINFQQFLRRVCFFRENRIYQRKTIFYYVQLTRFQVFWVHIGQILNEHFSVNKDTSRKFDSVHSHTETLSIWFFNISSIVCWLSIWICQNINCANRTKHTLFLWTKIIYTVFIVNAIFWNFKDNLYEKKYFDLNKLFFSLCLDNKWIKIRIYGVTARSTRHWHAIHPKWSAFINHHHHMHGNVVRCVFYQFCFFK